MHIYTIISSVPTAMHKEQCLAGAILALHDLMER